MIKKIISALLFTTLLLPVDASPELRIEPSTQIQGKHITVEFTTDQEDLEEISILFNNKTIHFPYVNNKYIAFIGLAADLKPGTYPLKVIKKDKSELSETDITVKAGKFGTENISYYKPPLSKKQQEIIKKEDLLVENAKNTFSDKPLWNSSFTLPVPDKITAVYGTHRYLNGKYNGYHGGVDFASGGGEPIRAINDGKVILAGYFSKYNSNGNIIFLDHGLGVTSAYLHQSKFAVKAGDFVKKGDIIGYVGSTGRSTGPHLHWGVFLNGKNTDGLDWVKYSKIFDKKN